MPLAMVVDAKGSRWRSITDWSTSGLRRRMADEPTTATGRRAAPRISAARCSEAFGAGCRRRPTGVADTSSVADASATSSGQVQVNGSKGLAQGDLERLGEHRGDAALPKGQRGFRDRPEERVMIDRHLDAPPELRRRQIARDRQERRAIEVGIPDSG